MASPSSMPTTPSSRASRATRARRSARAVGGRRRLVAVLGTMAQLGPASRSEHERIGRLAAQLRVDELIAVGEEARWIAAAAIAEGLSASAGRGAADADEALDS